MTEVAAHFLHCCPLTLLYFTTHWITAASCSKPSSCTINCWPPLMMPSCFVRRVDVMTDSRNILFVSHFMFSGPPSRRGAGDVVIFNFTGTRFNNFRTERPKFIQEMYGQICCDFRIYGFHLEFWFKWYPLEHIRKHFLDYQRGNFVWHHHPYKSYHRISCMLPSCSSYLWDTVSPKYHN